MARFAARVSDKRVLKLIQAFLNAAVMEDGLVRPAKTAFPRLPPVHGPILNGSKGSIRLIPRALGQ
jgi:RNA-directed DNA polymerase